MYSLVFIAILVAFSPGHRIETLIKASILVSSCFGIGMLITGFIRLNSPIPDVVTTLDYLRPLYDFAAAIAAFSCASYLRSVAKDRKARDNE